METDKKQVLERFAYIIRTYGIISSGFYDRLEIKKPSRWMIRQHFGSWDNAILETRSHLNEQGIKVVIRSKWDNDIPLPPIPPSAIDSIPPALEIELPIEPEPHPEVLRLTQQIQELTRYVQTTNLHLAGVTQKFGYISDSHGGSLYADWPLLNFAYDVFEKEKIKIVFHAGDITDGIKMYRGHEYELEAHGADNQVSLVTERYPLKKNMITYFITGNHDYSFWKHGGTEIGGKITKERPDLVHIGHQEADITIGEKEFTATVRLFHPDGGTAYAWSYQTQKYISSLASGTKPDILLTGHYHKALTMPYRGVYAVLGGTLQQQTPFMRGRTLAAVVGFWILEVVVGPNRIVSVKSQFYPVRS